MGGLDVHLRSVWHLLSDRDTPKRRRHIADLARHLSDRLSPGCRVLQGPFERRLYARDLAPVPAGVETALFRTTPLIVAQPLREADVAAAVQFARERGLGVYPRGVSSSPLGASVPTQNGLVIDLSRMNRVLGFNPTADTVTVQAGARWADLEEFLEARGMVTITVPSSLFSTVGGWVSTGGLGLNSYKYGHLGEAVIGAMAVSASGDLRSLREPAEVADFLGTEGQFGVLTEVELRVRQKPSYAEAVLLTFPAIESAFRFLRQLMESNVIPAHVAFYDRQRLAEENRLFRDRTGRRDAIVPEEDAVLLHLDQAASAAGLETLLAASGSATRHPGPAARYLWAERFFPLKGQRLGPNLLAAEFLLQPARVPAFHRKARILARRLGVAVSVEIVLARSEGKPTAVVIAVFAADKRRPSNYLARLVLAGLLLRLGLALGGRPYGVGIWNTPFVEPHFGGEALARLRRRKMQADPGSVMNPGKFFGLRTRFRNLPGWLLTPGAFRALLTLAARTSTLWGRLARVGSPPSPERWEVPRAKADDSTLISQAAQRCTYCGACVSTCPAYVLTADELVTGRAKLQVSEALFTGLPLQADETFRPFQCLRCGLCEEVCQTRLPLRECYDQLEERILKYFGPCPEGLLGDFVARVDQRRDWIERSFGLDLADWAPPGMTTALPGNRQAAERRG
jgi:FAD/FMN-containing dehydrogenase/ferredoxin